MYVQKAEYSYCLGTRTLPRRDLERALTEAQHAIEKLASLRQSNTFIDLLTEQIRREFDRRWSLLGLSVTLSQRAAFEPLICVGGLRWGRSFLDWRTRGGERLRSLEVMALAQQWLAGQASHETDLVNWLLDPMVTPGSAVLKTFKQLVQKDPALASILRAAMGKSEESVLTADQPSLLAVALRKAAHELANIEASAKWVEARRAS